MNSEIELMARKSVVIVRDERHPDDFCSGFIVTKLRPHRGGRTLIQSSMEFIKGRQSHLIVTFFDSVQLHATVVAQFSSFCLLETEAHLDCEQVKFLDDCSSLAPCHTFMVVPSTMTSMGRKETYLVVESLESYLQQHTDLVEHSDEYFVVACEYYQKTVNGDARLSLRGPDSISFATSFKMEESGLDRLTCAPVFTLSGWTLGVVLRDCRSLSPSGAAMKVMMKAIHMKKMLESYGPPPVPRVKTAKRKRGY